MDLRTALLKACAFAGKEQHGYVAVAPAVFFPDREITLMHEAYPLPHRPAFVESGDGDVTFRVSLDMGVDVPLCSMEAAALKKAVQAAKKEPFLLERTGTEITTLRVLTTGAQSSIPSMDYVRSLEIPIPMSWRIPDGKAALLGKVAHAADSDGARRELAVVHLTPWWVEATDQSRVARAAAGFAPFCGLVPARLFEEWPKTVPEMGVYWGVYGMDTGITKTIVSLHVGEENRWCRLGVDAGYFDFSAHFPEKHHGPSAQLETEVLRKAVKAAMAGSPTKIVELAFHSGTAEVRGVAQDGTAITSQVVPAHGATGPIRVALRGKAVDECLSVIGFPEVQVYYESPAHPVRFSAHGYAEVIWPLVPPGDGEVGEAKVKKKK